MEKIIQIIQNFFQKLSADQKRRIVLVCTGIFVILLTSSVILSLGNREKPVQIESEPERIYLNMPIPSGDLFLPDEPDFIPGVILEREQRDRWTSEDAAEFWQDPLRFGEEPWRQRIEAAIDNYLEHVQ